MRSPVKVWRNQKKVAALIGELGAVVSWTHIRVPPAHFSDQAPYVVVIVRLESGKNIMAQLVDWTEKDVPLNLPVRCVVRRITRPNDDDVIPYGIKVKPLENNPVRK